MSCRTLPLAALRACAEVGRALSARRSSLTVSTTASFAAAWLVHRLGRFSERHPETEIQVVTGNELTHIGPCGVDVVIRHGLGGWDDVEAVPLVQPRMVPVGSPALEMANAADRVAALEGCIIQGFYWRRDS